MLETITCRRADGREIALARLPLAQVLDSAETVRAEEIALSAADGRSVTTLINATPIHGPDGPDGALASVVVTMQDLAPLRELERMRAEFLGMVSHELRAPLTSIKGSAATVLRASRIFGPAMRASPDLRQPRPRTSGSAPRMSSSTTVTFRRADQRPFPRRALSEVRAPRPPGPRAGS